MELNKIIPVDEDNIDIAKQKASDIFYDNELTAEYLDARNITFEVVNSIDAEATMMAKLMFENYGAELSKEELEEHFYRIWKEQEYSKFVFDEMIKKLEENYSYSFKKINI